MKTRSKGVLFSLFLAVLSWWLGEQVPLIGAPVFAMLLGMVLAMVYHQKKELEAGLTFTSKVILQLAVVLLGFGLNLQQLVVVGVQSLPVIIGSITTALLIAYTSQKWLNIPVRTATLVGVGSSICGGSAIMATAPVIEAEAEEVSQAISVIFLFNLMAALLFPSLGQWLGLSHDGFALFAGTAVNDTSSVTATALAWDALHGSQTLDGATIVKLTRTLAIIPITFGLSLYQAGQKKEQSFAIKKAFPTFLLYFLLASLLTTVLTSQGVSVQIFHQAKTVSKFLIVMVMAAVGLRTDVVKLLKTGGSAILLGGLCWLGITLVTLTMQALLGLW